MACDNRNNNEREDAVILPTEMTTDQLEYQLHKVYNKYGFSTPIIASLKYSVPKSIAYQYAFDYIKLENLARTELDNFILNTIYQYSFVREQEYVVMARQNHYTRPIVKDEKISPLINEKHIHPYNSQRLIKATFPMLILKESLPCECNIPKFKKALDMFTHSSKLENLFSPINMGYIFYHCTPDGVKSSNLHRSGVGFDYDNLNPLKIKNNSPKIAIELQHGAIKYLYENDIMDKSLFNKN